VVLTACSNATVSTVAPSTNNPITSSPITTNSPTQLIVGKTISAMSQVSTFNLDTEVTEQYNMQSVVRWKGSKSIDISNKQMQIAMTIDNSDSHGNFGRFTINLDFINGHEYEQAWSPGSGNTGGIWNKYQFDEEFWNNESQLPAILELLKSSGQTMLLGSEEVNNIECIVLNFAPSAEVVADWVISQQQHLGPSLTLSYGGPSLIGKDMFTRTYKGGVFQMWISSDSYLLLKATFNPNFEAAADDFSQVGGQQYTMSDTISDFTSQLNFSNYDQSISIQLPTGASNATERQ
jgi:hypothetical protein